MFRNRLSINKLLQKTLQSSKSISNNNSLIQKKSFCDMSGKPQAGRSVRKRNKPARTSMNKETKSEFPVLFGGIISLFSGATYLLYDHYYKN